MLVMRAGEKKFSVKITDVKNNSKIIQKFFSIDDATEENDLKSIDLSTEKVSVRNKSVLICVHLKSKVTN